MTDRGKPRLRGMVIQLLGQPVNDSGRGTWTYPVLVAIVALLTCTPGLSGAQTLPCGIVLMHLSLIHI